jgi:hypothetical protein
MRVVFVLALLPTWFLACDVPIRENEQANSMLTRPGPNRSPQFKSRLAQLKEQIRGDGPVCARVFAAHVVVGKVRPHRAGPTPNQDYKALGYYLREAAALCARATSEERAEFWRVGERPVSCASICASVGHELGSYEREHAELEAAGLAGC